MITDTDVNNETQPTSNAAFSQKLLDNIHDLLMASLGIYGETLDEISESLEKARKISSERYSKLIERGEKLQKETKEKIPSSLTEVWEKNVEKARKLLKISKNDEDESDENLENIEESYLENEEDNSSKNTSGKVLQFSE